MTSRRAGTSGAAYGFDNVPDARASRIDVTPRRQAQGKQDGANDHRQLRDGKACA